MPVISFATTKGGGGKTTACIVLGSVIAQSTTVTLIDSDPAQRLVRWSKKKDLPDNLRIVGCTDEDQIIEVIEEERERSKMVLVDLEGTANTLNNWAFSRSNLVVIPMGDEQQDGEDAIKTMKQIKNAGRALGRDIHYRVLFTRVPAAVKSNTEKDINEEMRAGAPCFDAELCKRTAYSAMHRKGGLLHDLDGVNGVAKAVANAEAVATEIIGILSEKRKAA